MLTALSSSWQEACGGAQDIGFLRWQLGGAGQVCLGRVSLAFHFLYQIAT